MGSVCENNKFIQKVQPRGKSSTTSCKAICPSLWNLNSKVLGSLQSPTWFFKWEKMDLFFPSYQCNNSSIYVPSHYQQVLYQFILFSLLQAWAAGGQVCCWLLLPRWELAVCSTGPWLFLALSVWMPLGPGVCWAVSCR